MHHEIQPFHFMFYLCQIASIINIEGVKVYSRHENFTTLTEMVNSLLHLLAKVAIITFRQIQDVS